MWHEALGEVGAFLGGCAAMLALLIGSKGALKKTSPNRLNDSQLPGSEELFFFRGLFLPSESRPCSDNSDVDLKPLINLRDLCGRLITNQLRPLVMTAEGAK
jgi:hypothetical protein